MLAKTSTHTYFRTREGLFFSCTVFYSIQIVLCLSVPQRMIFLGIVKQRNIFHYSSKKNSMQIVRYQAEEGTHGVRSLVLLTKVTAVVHRGIDYRAGAQNVLEDFKGFGTTLVYM